MNKIHLRKMAQSDERTSEIILLYKAKEYDKIYELYGQQIYNYVAPKKHKEADIKKLIQQGEFKEISNKYGPKTYKKYLDYIKAQKKYMETGRKTPIVLYKIKNFIFRHFLPTAMSASLLLPAAVFPVFTTMEKLDKEKKAIEYQEQIQKYNEKIEDYAEEVKNMELTDMQIIMKVMSDMWESIEGYGNPQMNITGLYRLDLDNGGAGVCRNMADDVTAKLNAINPEYNARNMVCYIDENAGINEFANIERSYADVGNIQTEESQEQVQSSSNTTLKKLIGNHMVTIVDLADENITLVLDPTNPGIGFFKDGEIHMSFSETGKGIEPSPIGQFVLSSGGVIEVGKSIVKSLLPTELSYEELREIFGVEAQNQALQELDAMYEIQGGNQALDILQNAEREETSARDSFLDTLHVENPTIETAELNIGEGIELEQENNDEQAKEDDMSK